MPEAPHSFAYLFERFPSFVQTFVYREAVEMVRQGMEPWLVSIRRPDDPGELAEQLDVEVFLCAGGEGTARGGGCAASAGRTCVPRKRARFRGIARSPIRSGCSRRSGWRRSCASKGIRHVHAHFGGVAARTAWWLRKLFGFSYSFTGHANDIFCDTDFPVTNEASSAPRASS